MHIERMVLMLRRIRWKFDKNGVLWKWDSLICSSYLYCASSSPPLLRGATDTARILCWSFTSRRHRQLRVKDLPKVPTWRLERDSNPRPFGQKASNLPMNHHSLK